MICIDPTVCRHCTPPIIQIMRWLWVHGCVSSQTFYFHLLWPLCTCILVFQNLKFRQEYFLLIMIFKIKIKSIKNKYFTTLSTYRRLSWVEVFFWTSTLLFKKLRKQNPSLPKWYGLILFYSDWRLAGFSMQFGHKTFIGYRILSCLAC